MRRHLCALSLGGVLAAGCATTNPRFEQPVATSFAHDDMRRLVTADVEVYYPAEHRQAAERAAARAGECLRALRAMQVTRGDRGRALIFLTSANYNNAYVGGQTSGEPLHSLGPLFVTDELFHWYGLAATEPGDVSCHEMFHYAHYEQVENFWWGVNEALGPVMPSQAFLERWFTEGVAQYYEGRIRKHVGRSTNPLYRAVFESFAASRQGQIGAGDLSLYQRELTPFTGAYLTSLFFIEWLAETYGEAKLWEVMDLQARSFFSPFGASLRFKAVYGLSVGALLDQWAAHLAQHLPATERPPGQRVLRAELGQLARLTSDPTTGAMALITQGNEEVPMLRLLTASGAVRVERRLIHLTPTRDWVYAGPQSMTGLSFSTDGQWLYGFNDDLTARGDTSGQVWRIDTRTGEVDQVWRGVGTGMGGAVHPDGTRYTFVAIRPGRATVTDLDLATGQTKELLALPENVTVGALAWSPDGQRLVFSRSDAAGWNLTLREPDGHVRSLTDDGAFNYGAKFSDETHVVFARESEGRLQVHRLDVETLALEQLTQVPFGLVDPAPLGDRVAFLNRDGTQWSLDAAPLKAKRVLREATAATELPPLLSLAAHPAPPSAPQVEAPTSAFDHLFVPQLRAPYLNVFAGSTLESTQVLVGAAVTGRDRLGKHSWLLDASMMVDPSPDRYVRLVAEYRNLTLAPWDIDCTTAMYRVGSNLFASGDAAVRRSVFSADLGFGVRGVVMSTDTSFRRFIGPSVTFAYGAGDSTAYAGAQHSWSLDLEAAAYPRGIGSSYNLFDLGGGLSFAMPLPVSKRHNLVFSARARFLLGAPAGALTVGGVPRGYGSSYGASGTIGDAPTTYLPGSLVESVRGYENASVQANAVGVGQLRYRYNIIIDRGFASTAYVLPSVFFRQVNVEVFGASAMTDNALAPTMRAVGALVELKTLFGGYWPISAYYQFAYRFDTGAGPAHFYGLTFD